MEKTLDRVPHDIGEAARILEMARTLGSEDTARIVDARRKITEFLGGQQPALEDRPGHTPDPRPQVEAGLADLILDLVEASARRKQQVKGNFAVAKADDELQIVLGFANVAVHKDGSVEVDAHNDIIDPEELELASYNFVLEARASGEDHAGETDAQLVASLMFTDDIVKALIADEDGNYEDTTFETVRAAIPTGWFVGFHIPDKAAFERAKTTKTDFSIEGTAERVEV